jgi:hypothetical protein
MGEVCVGGNDNDGNLIHIANQRFERVCLVVVVDEKKKSVCVCLCVL